MESRPRVRVCPPESTVEVNQISPSSAGARWSTTRRWFPPAHQRADAPVEPGGEPALDLVDACATRQAAEAFLACARRADGATRAVLEQLFRLFVLQRLTPHAELLLVNGYLTVDTVRDLPPIIDRLGAEPTPEALGLVAPLGIPDELPQAPIATGDYRAACDDPAGPWQVLRIPDRSAT